MHRAQGDVSSVHGLEDRGVRSRGLISGDRRTCMEMPVSEQSQVASVTRSLQASMRDLKTFECG